MLFEGAEDLRPLPFIERRRGSRPVSLQAAAGLRSLAAAPFAAGRVASRRRGPTAAEGVMLKRSDRPMLPAARRAWYKWKRDPQLVDAVLMYAQRGHGKRSTFYSDYTFGLWHGDELVPSARPISASPMPSSGARPLGAQPHDQPLRPGARGESGLVLEVAFEGCIARPATNPASPCASPHQPHPLGQALPEADQLATLEKLLPAKV